MEKSLIILKPDCMEQNLAGTVLQRFAQEGFQITGCKMIALTESLLKEHYAHLADLPFFPRIKEFMASRPVLVLVLQGEDAISKIRALLGPTDPAAAPNGTLRGDFGTDKMKNIAHASDSPEAACAEIERFFKEDELF